jgi:electron transport complex protein RnfD
VGVRPDGFASPLFHLASGGAMLGAFFILTDPVSGATTARRQAAVCRRGSRLTYVIRSFGAYPTALPSPPC